VCQFGYTPPVKLRKYAKATVNSFVNWVISPFSRKLVLEKLGSDAGGWWVPVSHIRPDWTCYLAGVGEDITFDLALMRRSQCDVYAFDPTPRAIAHVRENAGNLPQYHFLPYGLWSEETELHFYAPKDEHHVSHSVVNRQHTNEYFAATVKSIAFIMAELGHKKIDLLKLDIEGAEWRVLSSIVGSDIRPRVICVEFDRPPVLAEALKTLRWVWAHYRLVHVDGKNFTFVSRLALNA
jgi:FkbM family methyltransferase